MPQSIYLGGDAGGGGGSAAIADPAATWAPDTAVTAGDRITHTQGGFMHVYEAQASGTTVDYYATFDELGGRQLPGEIVSDGDFDWKYIGIVGRQPFDQSPSVNLPTSWEFGPSGSLDWRVQSESDVTDYQYLMQLQARNGTDPVPVVEITSAGDSDFYLYDSGTGWRWHDTTNNASVIVNIGMDSVYVRSQNSETLVEMDRSTGAVMMPNLPTSNPNMAGQLWNDAGTLKVSAG